MQRVAHAHIEIAEHLGDLGGRRGVDLRHVPALPFHPRVANDDDVLCPVQHLRRHGFGLVDQMNAVCS